MERRLLETLGNRLEQWAKQGLSRRLVPRRTTYRGLLNIICGEFAIGKGFSWQENVRLWRSCGLTGDFLAGHGTVKPLKYPRETHKGIATIQEYHLKGLKGTYKAQT